jgi:hypothetical protein
MIPHLFFWFGGGVAEEEVEVFQWTEPTPVGPLTLPLTELAEVIAETSLFRTECGLASDDSQAAEKLIEGRHGCPQRIFLPEVYAEQYQIFPSATLQLGPRWEWSTHAGGQQNYLMAEGSVKLILVDEDNYPGNKEASSRDFATFAGNLLQQIAALFAYEDRLAGFEVVQEQAPVLCPIEEEAARGRAYWWAAYVINWSA